MQGLYAQTRARMTLELPREPDTPSRARAALGAIDESLPPEQGSAARLLVTELVTNAVKYGGDGPVRVDAGMTGGRFRAGVTDEGEGFEPPRRHPGQGDGQSGWGLQFVAELSDRWGVYAGPTHVWFELDLP